MKPSELLNPKLESCLRVSIREERLLVNELHVKQFWDEEISSPLFLLVPLGLCVLAIELDEVYALYSVILIALGLLLFPFKKWLYRQHNRKLTNLINDLKLHPYATTIRSVDKTIDLLNNNPYPVNVYQFSLIAPDYSNETFTLWDTVVYFQFLNEEDYILAKLQLL